MCSRLLKLFLSTLLFLHDRLLKHFRKLFGHRAPGTCVFLNYHTITTETRERFVTQMVLLARLTRFLPALKRQELEDDVHYVAVTFDDAFRGFAAHALPVLNDLRIPAILFVPTGYLGRESAWFDYGGENPVGEEVLSAAELSELVRSGGVEVGSHSVTHRNLVQLDEGEVREELADSKALLESLMGQKIRSLSFPYGSFGERELRLADESGYAFMFSVTPERLVGEVKHGLVGRVSVQPSDWPIEFKLKVLGAYRWLSEASACKQKLRRWLVARSRVNEPVHV